MIKSNRLLPLGSILLILAITGLGLFFGAVHPGSASAPAGAEGRQKTISGDGGEVNFVRNIADSRLRPLIKGNAVTTVTSTPNPSVSGQMITFTITVAAAGPGVNTPTGSVTLYDSGTPLGSATLNASGQATFSTSAMAVGVHASITAQYTGDPNFTGSTSTSYSQTVFKASTTTYLTSTPNPSAFEQSVTFTATVAASAPGAGIPTGAVNFYDNGAILGSATLDGSGVASFITSDLSVGVHGKITVQYPGDARFYSSSSGMYVQSVGFSEYLPLMTH